MAKLPPPRPIANEAELRALYQKPSGAAVDKETSILTPAHRAFIEMAPLALLATCGPESIDVAPRGEEACVAKVMDETTLALPDWRGNNRLDSYRNILHDERVSLLFMVPNSTTTLRVRGLALITADQTWRAHFAHNDKQPATVLVISVRTAFIHCGRALLRSRLWQPDFWPEPENIPTVGQMLKEASHGAHGGAEYDRQWPERAANTLY